MAEGVSRKEHYSPDDHASDRRKGNASVDKAKVIIVCFAWYAVFCFGLLLALIAFVAFSYLLYYETIEIALNAAKRADVISFIWSSVLLVLATMCIDRFLMKKKDD